MSVLCSAVHLFIFKVVLYTFGSILCVSEIYRYMYIPNAAHVTSILLPTFGHRSFRSGSLYTYIFLSHIYICTFIYIYNIYIYVYNEYAC